MKSQPYTPAPVHEELEPAKLRWTCPPDMIPGDSTEGCDPIDSIIGQERAYKAIELGVQLFSPGYNIFVCGLAGTGKATTIKSILEEIDPDTDPPRDFCYVNNFTDEDRPTLLTFERGRGCKFKTDMENVLEHLKQQLPGIFEEQEFVRRKQEIIDEFSEKQSELFTEFEEEIKDDGFILAKVQEGQAIHPDIMYRLEDKAVSIGDIGAAVSQNMLSEEQAEEVVQKYKSYRGDLQEIMRKGFALSREYQTKLNHYERSRAETYVAVALEGIREEFGDEKVIAYLDSYIESVLDDLDTFRAANNPNAEGEADFSKYEVNIVLDNEKTADVPVVIETAPNFVNLFGTIERQLSTQGYWFTDFTRIKAGSFLRADGGYLVLNAADALSEPGVWKTLKRVLLHRKLEIQSIESMSQHVNSALKPEAIDVNVKVILIGNKEIYYALSEYERDFKKIFKVKADFDYEIENTPEAVEQYTGLLHKLVVNEKLKHFDKTAIAGIVEYGARRAGSQKKLTTQFSEIADVVREATYWSKKNGNKYVDYHDVRMAIDELRNRHGLYEEKMQQLISDEVILIDVEGKRVGQINGLAVYGGDRFGFGKPSRITASISAGNNGIINIEREAKLSGKTHDKGVMILTGYIREEFAQKHPLALAASISFEQSYSGVDGDSASAAEMYALLSAIAGIPIKQQFAVTGSMNQKGDIQPIGGVNEKIEGFFDVCSERGLTGNQGVIIPQQNVTDLMLRPEIVDAVKEGKFHIYPISKVQQGVELLTGVKAGERTARGTYERNTVYWKVAQKLEELRKYSMPQRHAKKTKPKGEKKS